MNFEQQLSTERAWLQNLIDAFGVEEDDHETIEALANETDIERVLVKILIAARECVAGSEACYTLAKDYKERGDRLESRSEKLRGIVSSFMSEFGLKKFAAPEMTFSVRQGTPSVVTDINPEDAPPEYVKRKVSYSFDTKALREALERGEKFNWATLGEAKPVLTVRVK